MAAVGIDLGTTNSAVAVLRGRPVVLEDRFGGRTVPSAVGWDPDLGQLVVGIDAKNSPDLYSTVLSVKRKMGTGERVKIGPHQWLPEEVSAEILKVLKRQAEEKIGEPVTEAIITVPAYFQLAQKDATRRAGELAGLRVQQLLEEPSAAVMAYGPQQDEKILVYDLGGGTFDVTIVDCFAGALTTKAVFGNNNLGGDDFDNRLVDHFRGLIQKQHGVRIDEKDPVAAARLKRAAEEAKIEMSRKAGARVTIPKVLEVGGRPVGLEVVIKTADFDAMIRDLVVGTLTAVEKALSHAKLDKSDIDTILLVGGSTYYPLVQDTVRRFFNKEPNKKVNPDLAVALGAAASLVAEMPAEGTRRHVVTVGFVPESTPQPVLRVRGRTTPGSQVRVSGGAEVKTVTADPDGEYAADIPLKQGINPLVFTAVSPTGEKAVAEAEPILLDPKAVVQEEPPAPPAPILSRALSISHGTELPGKRYIPNMATVIIEAQAELPKQVASRNYCTSRDNQPELEGDILEGDLPVADLNTKLAVINLKLPPNVPAGEHVVVHFTVDENSQLTAELEVPSVNRRGTVKVDLKSPRTQVHIFQQVEDLYTRVGARIRPEERAALEKGRVALEDLCAEFKRLRVGGETEPLWTAYNRLSAEVGKLRARIEDVQKKYA